VAILDMFARDRQEIGIGEMAQELGLHRSTTSRLSATLAVAGYLEPAGSRDGTACPAGSPRWSPPRGGRGEHQRLRARLTHR
jgi:hypothetical protein